MHKNKTKMSKFVISYTKCDTIIKNGHRKIYILDEQNCLKSYYYDKLFDKKYYECIRLESVIPVEPWRV